MKNLIRTISTYFSAPWRPIEQIKADRKERHQRLKKAMLIAVFTYVAVYVSAWGLELWSNRLQGSIGFRIDLILADDKFNVRVLGFTVVWWVLALFGWLLGRDSNI